ncbi:DNA topoisomerase I [Geosporobacter subterraneus DSM 17957]|uniref:DNA topoisomerase 1 n=1 Tax=Geosporobacter subterraneus DSM 17957 TaxID=1121919 RepID=A0A1M6E5Q5_9FIRM|nr:type I DNA topoisomerase [Geosporobacter subterraneus]SHI80723.1 DNA topoisomerase I [Geosporobacter subterraneus DSM 17957]
MAKSLVIVESPAKAKTIGKFLGKNYKVVASVGHVRDLPKSKMGIDIENRFEPHYITIRGKGSIIQELKKEGKKAKKILLATDPDREGEAISWHLAHILSVDESEKCRIEFHEITETAIKNAVKKPRTIDKNLVDAQQARRVLDRLVGYSISPLLWRKIRKGLSAGRVQSVATKLICDREKEIESFIPQEYWSILVTLSDQENPEAFDAKFYGNDEGKLELNNKAEVDKVLEQISNQPYIVSDVKQREKKRNPYPPFITSSLQQEASNRLGFSTKKTMMIAQQLYEGIDLEEEGSVGLVTYIRTDSTRISEEAKKAAQGYILKHFSEEYLSKEEKEYKSAKDAQDAHEAIRPTAIEREPDKIKNSLSNEQYQLYKLIWERYLASQMAPAVYDTYSVEIKNSDYIFKANGSKLIFEGFLKVYTYASVSDNKIPAVVINQVLQLQEIEPKQHFTQPPPRFTEATLVKELEDKGIGRPSTYAPIISTILSRGYVEKESKAFKPTELGVIVNDLLEEYFHDIVDEYFTAELEKQLDQIEESKLNWIKVIDDFYRSFAPSLQHAEEEIEKIELVEEATNEICEECGKNMVIKYGKFGKFLACSGYPECQHTRPLVHKIGVACPKCGGDLLERRSKKGRLFYGCGSFPKCNFMIWNKPIDEKCPECSSLLAEKNTKKGNFIQCTNKECKYKREVEKDE